MSRYIYPRKKDIAASSFERMFRSLYERPVKSLRALTPDMLMAQYGVERKVAQYELMIAVQKRANEL